MLFLKQSTAVTVKIGPFLDSSDGDTAETGLTIAQADVLLSKNGGAFAQKNDATGCTHDSSGMYGCPLNTTDTGTLGRLQLFVHESGALAVWHEFMVVTANVYDSLCSTDVLQADVTQMSGAAQSATDLKDFADTGYDPSTHKVQGLVLCDTTTTNTDMVTDVSSDVTAIKAKTDNLPADPASETNVDANETKIDTVDTVVDAIKAKTDNLPADPADDSDIDSQLATIDTVVDAIKAKTDNLPADPADDSDIDSQLSSIATNVSTILKISKNKWAISGTTLTFYDDDGSTPLYQFTLDDADAPTSRTPV